MDHINLPVCLCSQMNPELKLHRQQTATEDSCFIHSWHSVSKQIHLLIFSTGDKGLLPIFSCLQSCNGELELSRELEI